jgi:hypothetical protein
MKIDFLTLSEYLLMVFVLVFLDEVSGYGIERSTGSGALANWGALATASIGAGVLAGILAKRDLSWSAAYRLAFLFAAVRVGIGYFVLGIPFLLLAIVMMLILYSLVSAALLVLGSRLTGGRGDDVGSTNS